MNKITYFKGDQSPFKIWGDIMALVAPIDASLLGSRIIVLSKEEDSIHAGKPVGAIEEGCTIPEKGSTA